MKSKQIINCFAIGAMGYPLLELLWRRRTHPSMALAGGLSLCALQAINRKMRKRSVPIRATAGALAITGIELISGLIFNRRYGVWDYRKLRCNYKGHICLKYTGLWYLLCTGLYSFSDRHNLLL